MCLIVLAWRADPRFELVLAANRDEFHERPAAPAAFWREAPDVFGGRDLSQGGSWLAVSRSGRFAAVTNVRRMVPPDPRAPSRGVLVADFLRGRERATGYAARVAEAAHRFAGFNLLIGDGERALYLSNQPGFVCTELAPGVHGVSNAALDTPWPKLVRAREGLASWLARGVERPDRLFDRLADDRVAPDAELPDTGVGAEMERFLSPPFIRGERYGTRASTVVLVHAGGRIEFHEHRFGPGGAPAGQTTEVFS